MSMNVPEERMTSSPYQILLVDGTPQNLQAMQRSLANEEGLSIVCAGSGPEALEMMREHDVALALIDARHAAADAQALAAQLRAHDPARLLPIVFLIDATEPQLPDFPDRDAGPVDFLYAPPDPHLLAAKVQVFRDLHHQQRQMAERLDEMKRLSRVNALMIGALSHDIRTPLAALALNAELVIRRAELQGLRQAGERIKAATNTLGRQVDHLVNLSSLPGDDLRPDLAEADLAAVARGRIDVAASFMLADVDVALQVDGEVRGLFDSHLIGEALDQLLLLCAIHGAGVAVRVHVDGHSRRALVLRVAMDLVLPEAACQHLFGGGQAIPGLPPSQVGPGLHATERVARAHGGSFVGRSRDREGTLFELILPRSDS